MITQNEISSLNLSPTKKDFVQIWNELIEVASKITERWDPTSTNESDPGIVLLKVLTGIADKLNYNIDKNILEAYMPTAAQMESMRKLCELVGYDIKYYQSAETKVRINYTGNTADRSDDNEEKLPDTGLALPKFTTITNADKDITFVTTNKLPMLFTPDKPWVEVPCIEGQISQCESINDNNLINLSQLDDNNRYYLPEIQIAENGIFVYNATASLTDGDAWVQVSNLNTQPSGSRVYKFGYDSLEGRPYLAFPTDVGSLIGDGLFIYFVRTSGLSGNISPGTLEVLEIPTGEAWDDYSAEQFEVVNADATSNGANIESISAAYNNFKKTVGTFDTLVTCRDYMNKIYSLMDASNSPYVSNILVTDIRNDINKAITLCSCNEFGILYKETPLTTVAQEASMSSTVKRVDDGNGNIVNRLHIEHTDAVKVPLIDHFDLLLYPFKTFTKVSSSTKDLVTPYNRSFTYTESMNKEIGASLADLKTCAHNLTTPAEGDIVAINNYLRLNALIATSNRISELEADAILHNVKVALVNEFNLRNLDFGEEIPFDKILSVIENADSRIKAVSLQEPMVLTTYSVKELADGAATSKEYGIVSTVGDIAGAKVSGVDYDSQKAKEIYNKLVLRNILAGRASLFDYDETFVPNNAEKPYIITKDITAALSNTSILLDDPVIKDPTVDTDSEIATLKSKLDIIANKINSAKAAINTIGEHVLYDNENSQPIKGFYGGIVTVLKSDTTEVYETYEHSFTKKVDAQAPSVRAVSANSTTNGIIDKIAKVEAACEISSTNDTFKNITLGKNEVIKFRAPNLITTKTFPAYVYYRFERSSATSRHANGSDDGSYATIMKLSSFIRSIGEQEFFTGLWKNAFERSALRDFNAEITIKKVAGNDQPVVVKDLASVSQTNRIQTMFSTAIACGAVDPNTEIDIENFKIDNIDELVILGSEEAFWVYVEAKKQELFEKLATDEESTLTLNFKYYPLTAGTMTAWGVFVNQCYNNKNGKDLPDGATGTILWRLASTSSHPKGKLVAESGQKLYPQDGNTLATGYVGEITYICTEHGSDPIFNTIAEGSDVALRAGDRLFIHYTPSSTNEDGETVNAEPISIVYEGGNTEDPVILKPSGFTLTPSDDVNRQGTSWKKTDVEFVGYGKKNLLSLAPNEQIELRSVSKVVLDSTARFYKNFDNEELEQGNSNKTITYELKDGEYLFYTDQNNQGVAYYGSGSVITLDKEAYIPKASELVEVSQILEQGLHIIPWSHDVLLNESKKVTITEYQYVTLVEGDTLNTLTLDGAATDADGNYTISSTREVSVITDSGDAERVREPWAKCVSTKANPITYTVAGAKTPTELPRIELDESVAWEVCSLLELSTSPGNSQQLRAIDIPTEGGVISIVDKAKVYIDDGTGISTPIEIVPQKTVIPASGGTLSFEPISIKLNAIAQTASGNFEKAQDDPETTDDDDVTLQMKVFSEEAPKLISLKDVEAPITPISIKSLASPVVQSVVNADPNNINNYWSAIDIAAKLAVPDRPAALNFNFMIPDDDMFGIFSIYVATSQDKLDSLSNQNMLNSESRIFIDIPAEFNSYDEIISIFNYEKSVDGKMYHWWSEGVAPNSKRLYLRAGLNCIKITKSCNLFVKAEKNAKGTLIYDSLRLVKGIEKHGINLSLIDFKSTAESSTDRQLAEALLANIAALDKDYEFYYNAPIENSLAIEFDKNINSFSNPYTLYDVNNINNNFVVSKLDVADLKTGLKIAKSSRY